MVLLLYAATFIKGLQYSTPPIKCTRHLAQGKNEGHLFYSQSGLYILSYNT